MEIKITKVTDWRRVVNAARRTIGKEPIGFEPSDEFKERMCRSEHSPLRLLEFDIFLKDVPFCIVSHLTRHKHGVEFFVASSRPDRGNPVPRSEQHKTDPCDVQISINAQALINISRKRLCFMAEKDTRMCWEKVIAELAKTDHILAKYCVRDCVYKLHCTEFQTCGWWEKHKNKN